MRPIKCRIGHQVLKAGMKRYRLVIFLRHPKTQPPVERQRQPVGLVDMTLQLANAVALRQFEHLRKQRTKGWRGAMRRVGIESGDEPASFFLLR